MSGSLYPGIQLLMGTGAVIVLWLGGRMVVAGTITLGEFVAFGAYLTMLHWPMIALGWVVNIFERGEASMGRLLEILDARARDPRRGGVARRPRRARATSSSAASPSPTATGPVLHDIDLEVPARAARSRSSAPPAPARARW